MPGTWQPCRSPELEFGTLQNLPHAGYPHQQRLPQHGALRGHFPRAFYEEDENQRLLREGARPGEGPKRRLRTLPQGLGKASRRLLIYR